MSMVTQNSFDQYVREILPEADSQVLWFPLSMGQMKTIKGMASVAYHLNKQINEGQNPKLFEGSDTFRRDLFM